MFCHARLIATIAASASWINEGFDLDTSIPTPTLIELILFVEPHRSLIVADLNGLDVATNCFLYNLVVRDPVEHLNLTAA